MLKSGGELGQFISKLPKFFEMLGSNDIARQELKVDDGVEFIKIAQYQPLRVNANLHFRALPELFRLKSARPMLSSRVPWLDLLNRGRSVPVPKVAEEETIAFDRVLRDCQQEAEFYLFRAQCLHRIDERGATRGQEAGHQCGRRK